jgi:hypothetical protein
VLSIRDEVYVTSQFLIYYINRESLHLFDRNGKHIRKLAEKGRGPGEFNSISYFFVDVEEQILYYLDQPPTSLHRIDLSSGMALDPLQIDFTHLTTNYINGKIYSFQRFLVMGSTATLFFKEDAYPDSTLICSISLLNGEMDKYQVQHKYSPIVNGTSIASYYNEIAFLNLSYSDTLFVLKDNKLNPLCVLRFSNKTTSSTIQIRGSSTPIGNTFEIISAYNNGIVLLKKGDKGLEYLALYDRKGSVCKISNTIVMGTQINTEAQERAHGHRGLGGKLSELIPLTCGKYGYMVVEHHVLQNLPAHFDPDNDNPILIVGTLLE